MDQQRSLSNNVSEKGAAMMEAALVFVIIFPTIILGLYFFILTHRLTTAHYQMQNTLRNYSVGPISSNLTFNPDLSTSFLLDLNDKLSKVGVKIKDGSLKIRNDFGCYQASVNAGNPTVSKIANTTDPTCPNNSAADDKFLVSNNFITLELDIDMFAGEASKTIFGIKFPTPRVVTGTRMGNF